ncbi:Nis1p NDAI_0F02460 [Naumovozyma dairenensis CBS 421]|uniref:Uncharacterized protein n=1 Tax=Naumovozyma dairenensis (strain ATCC 10597 / BCRC 20456 / CBS 421 / NBRC 0211 / NRRL Y-12639) TaxID=1071378 RepID=G0WCQ3_NAUDC|nr:hypothetical protein NDAI_0F02460 [Naumovozyma dairenensis CBS 421]CCD25564.1 hypothetical protein NDAI_0F02460 [Naumovozyma dairenensis CBS 421]
MSLALLAENVHNQDMAQEYQKADPEIIMVSSSSSLIPMPISSEFQFQPRDEVINKERAKISSQLIQANNHSYDLIDDFPYRSENRRIWGDHQEKDTISDNQAIRLRQLLEDNDDTCCGCNRGHNRNENNRMNNHSVITRQGSYASMKRVDFTNKGEKMKYGKESKYIFHKGFFKRFNNDLWRKNSGNHNRSWKNTMDKYRKNNKRQFRDFHELSSMMEYVNLTEPNDNPKELLEGSMIRLFVTKNMYNAHPYVETNGTITKNAYFKRANSIKRKSLPSSIKSAEIILHNDRRKTMTRIRSRPINGDRSCLSTHRKLKRSNSTPGALSHINHHLYNHRRRRLMRLWKEYMSLVILQRINLRIRLIHPDSPLPSSSSSSLPRSSISSKNHNNMTPTTSTSYRLSQASSSSSLSSPTKRYSIARAIAIADAGTDAVAAKELTLAPILALN